MNASVLQHAFPFDRRHEAPAYVPTYQPSYVCQALDAMSHKVRAYADQCSRPQSVFIAYSTWLARYDELTTDMQRESLILTSAECGAAYAGMFLNTLGGC